MPTRYTSEVLADSKDGFLWGLRSGAAPFVTHWNMAAREAYVTAYGGFTTSIVGKKYTWYEKISPQNAWERFRGYVTFNTSGKMSENYVESVYLRIYTVDIRSQKSVYNAPGDYTHYFASDYLLDVLTISGAINRNLAFSESYGIGSTIDYNDWGSYPYEELNLLTEKIGQITFSGMLLQGDPYDLNTLKDSNGNIYRASQRTFDILLNKTKINDYGESHFRVAHSNEIDNVRPLYYNDGYIYNGEFIQLYTREYAVKAPRLIFTYVLPDVEKPPGATITNSISTLRRMDLSIQRYLQEEIDMLYFTLSGVKILDGYPRNVDELTASRSIAVEHVSSIGNDFEMSSRTIEDERRFFITIVTDQKGELADLQEFVYSRLSGSIPLYDFDYGFIDPPIVSKAFTKDIRSFDIYEQNTVSKGFYQSIMMADFTEV